MKHLPALVIPNDARRLIVLCACILTFAAGARFWPLHPPSLARNERALELSDRFDRRLGTLYARDERRVVRAPLARISPHFLAALLATEDHRFLEHGAIDEVALLRAALFSLRTHRPIGGASTISMQLARLLDPVPPGLFGKLKEAFVAERLESGLSKERILEAYCNLVPMGSNLYGAEAAARTYFGTSAADLDLAQASLLAALPNDPVRLDPYRHWDALKARQRLVLERMRVERLIDTATEQRAFSERVPLAPQAIGIAAAPHFLFWFAARAPAEETTIRTTLDLDLQRFAQEQTREVVRSLQGSAVRDAAALILDNRTGAILAYVGSPDYFNDDILGRNDGVQALRQPGSALKPFLYELALERRVIRPDTILQDLPVSYALPGARVYQPHDYSNTYQGPVRVRIALADSLNVPAVRVLEEVGVPSFLDRLRALGFTHLDKSPAYYGLGLTLGGGEVSLYELTHAYLAMARASRNEPSWALTTDMLADAHARAAAFGVNSVLRLPFPAAVKTGTSSDYRDTWTVGFTRDYTVGVWVGNFDGTPMRRVSGVSGAGPLWNRIMLHLHERNEPPGFDPPRGYARRTICATTGAPPPDSSCSAWVMEYLDARDIRAFARPHARTRENLARLRIAFPRDGDAFVRYPSSDPSQRLQFAFAGARGDLRVFLNDRPLLGAAGDYLWPLSLGSYTLRVSSAGQEAVSHFSVIKPPARRNGFTLLASP